MENIESNRKRQNQNLQEFTVFGEPNLVPDLNRALVDPNYTNYMINLLQTSIFLQTLNYNPQQNQSSDKTTKNNNQTNQNSNSNQDKSQKKEKHQKLDKKCRKSLSAYKNSKIKLQESDVDQPYEPDLSYDKCPGRYKASETKNVTKNFGKAIITFILKERDLTSKVLSAYKIDQQQFIEYATSLKYTTNSIRGLRALWVSQGNPFAKQLRILSFEFLRKHNLNYLFNSRVRNHSRALKYRKKILEGLQSPENFTFMKQY